jgi:hypothetical protein
MTVRLSDLTKQEERVIAAYGTGAGVYQCCTDGTNVWIPNLTDHTITKRLIKDGSLVGTYACGTDPFIAVYDNVRNYVWVSNNDARTATVINAATGGIVATYNVGPAGALIYGMAFDGEYIWAANTPSATVSKVRASDGTIIGSYATSGASPYFVCCDGTNVWVGIYNSDVVDKFVGATGAFVGSYAVTRPCQIAYDGTNIWIASQTTNVVRKLLAATGGFIGDYAVGTSAFGVAFDGTYVWVTATTSTTVVKLLATTGALISRYTTGSSPLGVCWDGSHLWVVNNGANTVTKIGARQILLAFGAEDAAGALWLEYAGREQYAPLMGLTPQLRLRMWDDLAALVSDMNCGAVTAAQHEYVVEWAAAIAKLQVLESGAALATYSGAVWTPEGLAVAPLYIGSDPTPANAAHCLVALVSITDY